MIRVLKGKVKSGGTYHGVGDTIDGLSRKGEAVLIELGLAERIQRPETKPAPESQGGEEVKSGEKPDKSDGGEKASSKKRSGKK